MLVKAEAVGKVGKVAKGVGKVLGKAGARPAVRCTAQAGPTAAERVLQQAIGKLPPDQRRSPRSCAAGSASARGPAAAAARRAASRPPDRPLPAPPAPADPAAAARAGGGRAGRPGREAWPRTSTPSSPRSCSPARAPRRAAGSG